METIKYILSALLAILIMSLILIWSNDHDKKVEDAGEKYLKCILEQYRKSPAEFYRTEGYYPECNLK